MSELPGDSAPPPPGPRPLMSYQSPVPAGGLDYALWADRVLAALIDGGIVLLLTGVLLGVFMLLGVGFTWLSAAAEQSTGGSGPLGSLPCCFCCGGPFICVIVGFLFGLYNKVYLVGIRGYSIGQGFRHLKVVMRDGRTVPHSTLFLRLLVQCAFGFFWPVELLNLLWPLWDLQRQTLHDKAVGTFVIVRS